MILASVQLDVEDIVYERGYPMADRAFEFFCDKNKPDGTVQPKVRNPMIPAVPTAIRHQANGA